MKNIMTTFTGKQIDILHPTPNDIDIRDIAHGLSLLCRFSGQCDEFYSVAEHSLLASSLVDNVKNKKAALLHDAAEAYIGDLITPVKKIADFYRNVESKFNGCIKKALKIDPVFPSIIKDVDNRMFKLEVKHLLPNHPLHARYAMLHYSTCLKLLTPKKAERLFLCTFNFLTEMENMDERLGV